MKRTSSTLADGREILYYDLEDGAVRELVDPRDLPPVSTAPQLRRDPFLDEWVMIASHRQARTFLPPTDECPLCPSTPTRHTEIPATDYDVAIFENRFPSLSTRATTIGLIDPLPMVPLEAGFGRCEVVCFTSDHTSCFADLPAAHARLVVDAWADRTAELSAIAGIAQVFCFESRGEEIGVTLSHPHGQIYAYPFVTPRTSRMLDVARAYRAHNGSDVFADLLAAERRAGERVVAGNDRWTAFVPAAARWPVEVHLFPHRRVGSIPELTDGERDDFVALYLDVLGRFDRLFDGPLPYISAWHQAPVDDADQLGHLHLQLFSVRRAADKLKYLAGSESGMGAFITDLLPEDVAAWLRDL